MNDNVFFPDFNYFFKTGLFDVIEDYRDIHADVYDLLRGDTKNEIDFYKTLLPSNNSIIAELGCGTGCLTIPLAKYCKSILAIDNSPDMLNKLKKKCNGIPKVNEVIQLKKGNFVNVMNTYENYFDLIIIPFNTLVHILSPRKHLELFQKCAVSLKQSGYLVVDLWMPRQYKIEPLKRFSVVSSREQAWAMYSQEKYLPPHTRILNIMMISLMGSRKPALTTVREYVFHKCELRKLFAGAGLKLQRLPINHPLLQGNKRRLIYFGRKK